MSASEGLHFLVNVTGTGYHKGGWREPGLAPTAFTDVEYYAQVAKTAERGLFDAILYPDIPIQAPGISDAPTATLEPSLLAAALSLDTEHIGFLPTISSTFNRPYNLARRILSLDHITHGRAGWNLVTTFAPAAAANFGLEEVPTREDRYRRAAEFVDVATRLWDSWEDDALLGDQQEGLFADTGKIHRLDHDGEFFRVAGPMNVPRSPQGRPVLAQAGASEAGVEFAAHHAEVIYASQLSLAGALDFARRVRDAAAGVGRDHETIRILPGLVVVTAAEEEQAWARWDELQARLRPVAIEAQRLEEALWIAPGRLEGIDLDAPIEPGLFLDGAARPQGFALAHERFAADTGYSPRELVKHVLGGHRLVVGTPRQVADHIEEWYEAGAVNGFTIVPPALPADLDDFVDLVVPELQRRGLYRDSYPGTTLRANLGLPVPANRFAAA